MAAGFDQTFNRRADYEQIKPTLFQNSTSSKISVSVSPRSLPFANVHHTGNVDVSDTIYGLQSGRSGVNPVQLA